MWEGDTTDVERRLNGGIDQGMMDGTQPTLNIDWGPYARR
jgi:hypothetical protein